MASEPQGGGPSNIQALLLVAAMVPLVGVYIAAGSMLGIGTHLFTGFLFALYWMGIRGMAATEFLPSLVGALCGLGTGYLVFALPPALGMAGMVIAGAVIVLVLFLLMRGKATFVVNNAFLLMLTIGTTVAFRSHADYAAGAVAIVLAAAYGGGMAALVARILRARAGPVEPASV